jgi:hypothetical protein
MNNADQSQWATADRLVRAAIHLAGQDAGGITGTICTDEEFCAFHNLK